MNTLQRLHLEQDQSPWIDFIDRDLVESGRLNALIRDGIRGLTSNPTIFANAIASGQYDALVHRTVDEGRGNEAIYEAIRSRDAASAKAAMQDHLLDSERRFALARSRAARAHAAE